jgi:hypothetical protein
MLEYLPQRVFPHDGNQLMDIFESARVHDSGDHPLRVLKGLLW